MSIGKRLLSLRQQKGMSQEELANQLHVSRQTISKWESEVSQTKRY
ncbi:helix-turn-helix transcriptional regulator [Longibaculum muris]|nr:helix-turn-helix transcriptional regulator [Longibaculum muris]